jgi:hypothetical protein
VFIAAYTATTAILYNYVWNEKEKSCFWGGLMIGLTALAFFEGNRFSKSTGIVSAIMTILSGFGISFRQSDGASCSSPSS